MMLFEKEEKRVNLSISLAPSSLALLDELANLTEINRSRIIEALIAAHVQQEIDRRTA